ncbi:MAG: cellulase family glycosylhydrolase [Polyangiaceae bacterium]|nr:cellulase family glycosylhydrolase [Polyangiaceae bacterium]
MLSSRLLRRAPLLAVFAVALVGGCGSSDDEKTPAPEPQAESPRFITDAKGRVLILRGINTSNSTKADPDRSPRLTDADIDRIAHRWGFNFVRYLILWDALEPSPGQIDAAYLERIAADVKRLGEAGVYVMLDMHQDVYAAKYCCDGAPAWAIRDDGLPFEQQELWALNYMEPAVQRAFDNFWDAGGPHADLQQRFAATWQAVAARFAGEPSVIGYDLFNEPFPGSDFDGAEALFRKTPEDGGTSKTFDETKLGPFYQRVIDAIRKVDSDHWIFFESRYGAPANGSPSYIPKLTDRRPGGPRLVFAPHLYSAGAEATGRFSAGDPTVSLWETQRAADLARHGGPLLLGEWFSFTWADPNSRPFVDQILTMADRLQIGWAYWAYDPGSPTGSALRAEDGTDNPATAVIVRPYPRAIAGVPVSFGFDASARALELTFEPRAGVTGPTELAVPAHTYPEGFDVEVPTDPGRQVSFDAATGVVRVTTDPNISPQRIRVVPKPKGP